MPQKVHSRLSISGADEIDFEWRNLSRSSGLSDGKDVLFLNYDVLVPVVI